MRNRFLLAPVALSLLATALSLPAHAEGVASSASSTSSAGSASSASLSDSVGNSSESSSGEKKVAEGEYRVVDVAQAAGRADTTRLKLQPTAGGQGQPFYLYLPNRAMADKPLRNGDLVRARQRDYGFEFARAQTREPFFLVLDDDWHRELASHRVTL